MAANDPVPSECFLCARPFVEGERLTVDHVIPRKWFDTPPPLNLPTLRAHENCNNELSGGEERLRNVFVRGHGHNPGAFLQVADKATRSRQPFPRTEPVDYITAAGVTEPAELVSLDPEDLHAVFRKIVRGLFFKASGRQMTNGPVRVTALPKEVANPLSHAFINQLKLPTFRYGEFFWMHATTNTAPDSGIWLFLVFAAGIVCVQTGEEVIGTGPPSAAGIVIRPL